MEEERGNGRGAAIYLVFQNWWFTAGNVVTAQDDQSHLAGTLPLHHPCPITRGRLAGKETRTRGWRECTVNARRQGWGGVGEKIYWSQTSHLTHLRILQLDPPWNPTKNSQECSATLRTQTMSQGQSEKQVTKMSGSQYHIQFRSHAYILRSKAVQTQKQLWNKLLADMTCPRPL